MSERKKKIAVFDKYILSSRESENEVVEVWKGRNRKSNQQVIVYIFKKQLVADEIFRIKKWVILSSYKSSIDHLIRYLEFITAEFNSSQVNAVIIRKLTTVPLSAILEEKLTTYQKIDYFHQVSKSMCFIHGTGTYHQNISSKSILQDCITRRLKIWKSPEEIIQASNQNEDELRAEEYFKIGKILRNIVGEEMWKYDYVEDVIRCYLEEKSETRLNKASPRNIHELIKNGMQKVKNKYIEIPLPPKLKLVRLVSLFRSFNLPVDGGQVNGNKLLKYFHDILPQIKNEEIKGKSRQTLQIVALLCGITVPANVESFPQRVMASHALISYVYRTYNTNKVIKFITNNYNDPAKAEFLKQICIKPDINCFEFLITVGKLEEYRSWYKEQYFHDKKSKKNVDIHNLFVNVIINIDEWFFDSFGVGWKDILIGK